MVQHGHPKVPMTNVRENAPYLSVVVTARNDDHGGSLLRRMQTFVNSWIGQSKRHGLQSELIIVEWNPPPERPSLHEALSWPSDLGFCSVRFVKVPHEMHLRYRYWHALPLYQMIAKNVGIRRARGPFVLVTNIDIVFSDELVSYLAEGQLQRNRMYRIDRLDVSSDVPVDGSVDEQLRYCRSHLIRCNTRNGTFSLTADGQRTLERVDIAAPGCEVSFGEGWFPPESDGSGGTYRWMENDAEVTVRLSPDLLEPLTFELEPGPSAGDRPLTLQAVDGAGRILTESAITGRSEIRLSLLPCHANVVSFRFNLTGGGLPVSYDLRNLNLRAMRCGWERSARCAPPAAVAPTTGLWMRMMRALASLAQDKSVNITPPRHSKLRGIVHAYVSAGGITGAVMRRAHRQPAPAHAARADLKLSSTANKDVVRPALLHTNACGDFTLMAREHWFDLRGYPEFDLFSMNLDSVLCHSAHHTGFQEEILRDPLRIYHIEHGTGWTPEGQVRLFNRLRSQGIPWLEYQEFMVLAQQMHRLDSPMIFNRPNWGLADLELEETVLGARCSVAAPHSH